MSQQVSTSQKSSIWTICLGLLVVLLVVNQLTLCNARYLPTRADESRKNLIKQMLKELMDMPQQYDTENRYENGKQHAYGYQDGSYINKRSISNENLINRLSS